MRIKALPPTLANQIAAGEVIERPASVVKELLENALDAKASIIDIELRHGGLNQIKVSDNGFGIMAADLLLAIAPHATSKIAVIEDLFSIESMGFRGEALASISSVSHFIITSKTADEVQATTLELKNEDVKRYPAARAVGTTIEVSHLFYNTPVRKVFLKSERTELLAIEAVIKRFALSAPTITIRVSHNGAQLWQLPGALNEATLFNRIQKIMGKPFMASSRKLDMSRHGMQLLGYISDIEYQRNQNDKVWMYVNGRMVKDKLLNHAIKQAYEGQLYPGRHPSCLLYLTLSPKIVDVNVHPTKHEVRFQEPRLVHDFIVSAIKDVSLEKKSTSVVNISSPYQGESLLKKRDSMTWLTPPHPVQNTTAGSSAWIGLNEHFAILQRVKPLLIDVKAAYRAYIFQQLTLVSLPLTTRPLLVPVFYRHDRLDDSFQELLPMLAAWGIESNFSGPETLMLRSIPTLFPQLDLIAFIHAVVCNREFFLKNDMHILADFDRVNAEVMSVELKTQVIGFIDELLHHSVLPSFIRDLTVEACRALFHE